MYSEEKTMGKKINVSMDSSFSVSKVKLNKLHYKGSFLAHKMKILIECSELLTVPFLAHHFLTFGIGLSSLSCKKS